MCNGELFRNWSLCLSFSGEGEDEGKEMEKGEDFERRKTEVNKGEVEGDEGDGRRFIRIKEKQKETRMKRDRKEGRCS